MKRSRWMGGALCALLVSLAAAGCGAAGSGSGGKIGVAVFLSSASNSYEQAQGDGAKAAAKALGAGPVQVFDGGFDSTKQLSQIQDAVTSGRFKAFVVEPINGSATAELQRAASQGIQVVCVTSMCGPSATSVSLQFPKQAGVVGSSYASVAAQLARRSIQACQGIEPCTVFYLNGDSTFPSDRAAKEAFAAVMKTAPSTVTYAGSQDGQYDTGTGRSVMQNELQRAPGIDVLASLADQQTLGAEQAISAAGKTSQVKVISFGGSVQGVTAVRNGQWLGDLVTLPYSIGKTGAEIAIKKAEGKSVKNVVDASTLSTLSGGYLTKADATSFTAQWKS